MSRVVLVNEKHTGGKMKKKILIPMKCLLNFLTKFVQVSKRQRRSINNKAVVGGYKVNKEKKKGLRILVERTG